MSDAVKYYPYKDDDTWCWCVEVGSNKGLADCPDCFGTGNKGETK